MKDKLLKYGIEMDKWPTIMWESVNPDKIDEVAEFCLEHNLDLGLHAHLLLRSVHELETALKVCETYGLKVRGNGREFMLFMYNAVQIEGAILSAALHHVDMDTVTELLMVNTEKGKKYALCCQYGYDYFSHLKEVDEMSYEELLGKLVK